MKNKTTGEIQLEALHIYRNIACCFKYPINRRKPQLHHWINEEVMCALSKEFQRAEGMMDEIEKRS